MKQTIKNLLSLLLLIIAMVMDHINSHTIPLENFSNGLYLLQLKDEKGRILGLEKFVKGQ